MPKQAFEKLDMVTPYADKKVDGNLLTDLGLFDREISQTAKVEVDYLLAEQSKLLNTTERYGSDLNDVSRDRAKNFTVEIPHVAVSGKISSADFQGHRAFGTDRETTALELLAAEGDRQFESFTRTREKMFAQALFEHKVIDPHTNSGLVDYAEIFGKQQGNQTLKTGAGTIALEQIDNFKRAIRRNMGGMTRSMPGFVMVCDDALFSAIKWDPTTGAMIKDGLISPNFLFNNKEKAPGYEYFSVNGVTFVQNPNPDYAIGEGEGFLFPMTHRSVGSYARNIVGPASRNFTQAASGQVRDFYAYVLEDKLKNPEVYSEFSCLPVIYRPDFVSKITLG
ncbi:major capsid protein [Serratia nevei]|uniref:major capsid protein n=1 Tax=Serratia nevei TaxID=2703794 RepID=UPI002543A523|nr:major capsid protein [Serratia nevei]EMB4112325.1 major capsid protein [Serratia marcescens]WIJ66516.1 major capsid protein [Serratia nevei]